MFVNENGNEANVRETIGRENKKGVSSRDLLVC